MGFYDKNVVDNLLENDCISDSEEGFMLGYLSA